MQNHHHHQSPTKTPAEKGVNSYICYLCNKPGHFIKDCPEITPKRSPISQPSSSSSSPKPDPNFPTIHCRCGAGLCEIRVSASLKNPNRKYYRCPGKFDKNCSYFKWCDMLREDEVRKSQPEFNFPTCPCGAGVCTVRVEEISGPDKGRSFFACPIKKGDGACSFKQWLDNSPHSALIIPEDEGAERNSLLEEFDLSYEEEMQIDAIEMGAREPPLEEVPTRMDGEQDKTSDGVHEISARSAAIDSHGPRPVENNEIHPCSVENNATQNSLGLESTTENPVNDSAMENVQQSATKVVANPQNPASPGTFPNFDLVTMPEYNTSAPSMILEDSSEEGFDASPGLDNQPWSGGLLKDSLNKGTSMSGTILEAFEKSAHHFQNKLITILESMDPKDHEAMSKEANCTFAALDHLQVDYGLFHLRVTEYIKQASSLAHIEQTINEDAPSKELLNRYEIEKSHYDEVFRAYCEANDAYIASSKRLKTLRKDASYLRDLLGELEKELGHYEVENAKDQDSLDRISKTMSECKVSFREATEALNRNEKREIERSAAKAAFETARAQLRK